MNLTEEDAYRLSILKWEWIVKNWDYSLEDAGLNYNEMLKDLPELKGLNSHCGFCEYYRGFKAFFRTYCESCPLAKVNEYCGDVDSLHYSWVEVSEVFEQDSSGRELSIKLLDLIKELYKQYKEKKDGCKNREN